MRVGMMILGLWGAATVAIAAAQQAAFPLGYYSFPEIAQRMSVEGRRIECARDLQQRLALIHLQPRPWQQTRELLEAGLDVRFRKISDAENRWILERDPEIARLERQRRERLANLIDAEEPPELQMFRIIIDKTIPPEKALEQLKQLMFAESPETELDPQMLDSTMGIIRMAREMPFEAALQNWRAYTRLNQQFHYEQQENRWQLTLKERSLASLGFSRAELEWAERMAKGDDPTARMLMEGQATSSDDPVAAQASMLRFLGMMADSYRSTWALNALKQQMQPPLRALEVIERGVAARVYEMSLPPELAAWILNDAEGARVPIGATQPVPMRLAAIADQAFVGYGLSTRITPLNLEERQESPLSRFPAFFRSFDFSPRAAARSFRRFDPALADAYQAARECHLKLLEDPAVKAPLPAPNATQGNPHPWYRWAQANRAEIIAEMYIPLPLDQARGNTLAELLESGREPYLLERRDSVWIIRHWAAFWRRTEDLPHAALYALVRSDYDYNAWRAFYRSVTPEQARWLVVAGYREVPDFIFPKKPNTQLPHRSLAEAWLMMTVLESLPPDLRERLWNDAEDAPTSVPLASLSPAARAQLAQTLHLWRDALAESGDTRWLIEESAAIVERLHLRRAVNRWWELYLPSARRYQDMLIDEPLVSARLPGKPLEPEELQDEEGAPILIPPDGIQE
ncbi:MAG: hypothetical protein WHS44_11760 [Fimbriimonadales bacterium]|nr:MAG: hypothetical protein KatS3mg018_2391 [Fimbriimonadales bacterium]